MVAAIKGYSLTLVMPESMSIERRKINGCLWSKIGFNLRELGMKGAIIKAQELAEEIGNVWIPQQFDNRANPEIHRKTMAQEILNRFF